jgi:hypothetical protein
MKEKRVLISDLGTLEIIRICVATGGRTFRSDINRAISSRLQPLRNWFCGWHTDSQSSTYATCFAASIAAALLGIDTSLSHSNQTTY